MDKRYERTHLDSLAAEYYKIEHGVNQKSNKFQASYVLEFCKGPDLLEMGVSTGDWLDVLFNKFKVIDIVDAVYEFLSYQKTIYKDKINVFHSLFEDFEPIKKYDTINLAHILEHVSDPVDILKLVSEWLKEDGVINILVPHANSFHKRLGVTLGMSKSTSELTEIDHSIGHRRVYNIKTLEKHIRESGFQILYRKGLIFKPLNNYELEALDDSIIDGMLKLDVPIEYSGILFYQCRGNSGR